MTIAPFLYFTDEEMEAQSHQAYRSSLKATILFFQTDLMTKLFFTTILHERLIYKRLSVELL